MVRRRLAVLILAVLLVLLSVPASAAGRDALAVNSPDPGPLDLTIRENESADELMICGLSAGRSAIPAHTLLPLIRTVTADDARFASSAITVEAPAATGVQVEWTRADGSDGRGELVVMGDVLGTGTLGISQLTRMAAALTGSDPLEGAFLEAADVSGSGDVTITDIVIEAKAVAEIPAIGEEAAEQIIKDAVELQAGDGSSYSADVFHVVQLKKGDVIYGMLPGQSAFYTDAATVEACGGSYVLMYQTLQMLPHPEFGYREQLGTYTVSEDTWVAAGYCLANSEIDGTFSGPGGGFQYVIPDFETVLEQTDTTDLHE